jgi:hypothetical protein
VSINLDEEPVAGSPFVTITVDGKSFLSYKVAWGKPTTSTQTKQKQL